MDHAHLESIHRQLCLIEDHARWAEDVLDELHLVKMELRFLKRFSRCFFPIIHEDDESTWVVFVGRLSKTCRGDGRDLRLLASKLASECEHSKVEVKRWCKHLSDRSLTLNRSNDEILIRLDAVFNNLKDLLSCKKGKTVSLEKEMQSLEVELVFLQNFLRLAAISVLDKYKIYEFKAYIDQFTEEDARLTFLYWANARDEGMDLMISDMLQKIPKPKPYMLSLKPKHFGSPRYKAFLKNRKKGHQASTGDETPIFVDALLINVHDLVSYKADNIAPFKKQIEVMERKVVFLQTKLRLAGNGIDREVLPEFETCVHDFAQKAACLTFSCWLKAADEDFATKMDHMISDMVKGLKPHMPSVIVSCFRTLKASKWRRSEPLLLGQTIGSFVDLLLDNLSTHLKDDFQILWEGLIFLLSFVADSPNDGANDEELTLVHNQIDVLLKEGSYLIAPLEDMEEDFSMRKVPLSDFVCHIERVSAKIRRIYCNIPDSSVYNFPRIIGLGFIDVLIRNLRDLKDKPNGDIGCVSL